MNTISASVERISITRHSLGIFFIRFIAGLIFFMHGWDKLHSIPNVISMFQLLGMPWWLAYVATVLEVVGGAALMLGVAMRSFGLLLGVEMVIAALTVNAHMPRGFHGVEFELLLAAVSFGIAFAGNNMLSLYAWQRSSIE
ncbi:MAG TPA: DoxX family protein [Candidatus Paceibacterota bacterium]